MNTTITSSNRLGIYPILQDADNKAVRVLDMRDRFLRPFVSLALMITFPIVTAYILFQSGVLEDFIHSQHVTAVDKFVFVLVTCALSFAIHYRHRINNVSSEMALYRDDLQAMQSANRTTGERHTAQIEELVKENETLRKAEEKYQSIFDNAVEGIFQSTPSGQFIDVNNTFVKMLGYQSKEEFLSSIMDIQSQIFVNPERREEMKQQLDECGIVKNFEFQARQRNGNIIWVSESTRAVRDARGKLLYFEGVVEDITEQKLAEEKLQQYNAALKASQEKLAKLNAQKNKMMSVLSHDLRSPFSSILGFCSILIDEQDTLPKEERQEFISYIKEAVLNQLQLLNNLLDWSRIESGRTQMNIAHINLQKLVKQCVQVHLGLSSQKKISLISKVSEEIQLQGDQQLLLQVFNNFVSNALKFTPAGGTICVDVHSANDKEVVVAIRDTGIGIPKDDLKKLFKVEEKYSRTGLAGEKGTGLGLSICYEIMEKHDGSIHVESEVNKGTAFYLHFPVTRNSGSDATTILIADDERGVRALHAKHVKRIVPDVNIIEADDGKEALHLAQEHLPHMIITDYSMPNMNGFQLLHSLREEQMTKNIPVIIITGQDSFATAEVLKEAGAREIFSKPIDVKKLEDSIGKFISAAK